jgi:uncharacterized iron-regulated protein
MTPTHALVALLLTTSCAAIQRPDGSAKLIDGATGTAVSVEEAARDRAGFDVVFLGELHDSDSGHAAQLALAERLLELRGTLVLSMEQFERDVQASLDDYLAGAIDEATFLESSRPWPNYREHYRPAIELAKLHGLPVIAGNVPRALAARVVKEGPTAVLREPFTPRQVSLGAGAYKNRFVEVMGDNDVQHEASDLDLVFAAQSMKDDAMAESIADFLARSWEPKPLVVHWCGAFHSDYELGTVERLRQRMPRLRIAVLSMRSAGDAALDASDLTAGRYVILVRDSAG